MLNWSNAGYKFTLGIGSLAMAAAFAEIARKSLPVWLIITIAIVPLAVFIFIRPGELPARLVTICHVAVSLWYVVTAISLHIALFASGKPLPTGWPLFPVLMSLGLFPCGLVLWRAIRGGVAPSLTVGTTDAAEFQDIVEEPRIAEEPLTFADRREFPYRPRWTVIIGCWIFFGALAPFFADLAVANQQGLVIKHVITFGPDAATALYWVLCAASACFVVATMWLTYLRLTLHQRLVIDQNALIVPVNRWSAEELEIKYEEIVALSRSEVQGQQFLHVVHPGGRYYITSSMLGSNSDFEEICSLLKSRVANCKSAVGELTSN